jgi:hypothetical protein
MIESSFSVWEIYRFLVSTGKENVHHANEPGSCGDGSYGEIRRSCLCLAPLIHLLRGPRARIVAMGMRTTPGKKEREGIDGEEAVSREEI